MKKILLLISLVALAISCDDHNSQTNKTNSSYLNQQNEFKHYNLVKRELLRDGSNNFLGECNCMKAFYRDWRKGPNESSRYAFDRAVGKHAVNITKAESPVKILAIGPGTLLNELTAFSYALALGKDLKIYLTDHNYIFYGQEDFEEEAIRLAVNKEARPAGWKEYYIWDFYINEGEEFFLNELRKHHNAIDHFKKVISRIADHYGRTVTIELIPPAKRRKVNLPELDIIIAIDAFKNVYSMLYGFSCEYKLKNPNTRFMSLNKPKYLGGFWDGDLEMSAEHHEVVMEIFDINSTEGSGDYRLIEKKIFFPSEEQIKFYKKN